MLSHSFFLSWTLMNLPCGKWARAFQKKRKNFIDLKFVLKLKQQYELFYTTRCEQTQK